MKIIHYIGRLSFGGIERLVHDLVVQQKSNDQLDPSIAVGNVQGEFEKEFRDLQVPIHDLKLKSGYDFNFKKISKIISAFKASDVIHLHGFHMSVALSAILSNKKIIYTEHGNFGFGRAIKRSDKFSFLLRRWFFKYPKVVVCANSEFTKALVQKRFYNGKRLALVYNGSNFNTKVNTQLLQRLQTTYANKFVVGVVGRLAGVKRIDKVIKVFSEYCKRYTDGKLLVLGEGVEKQHLLQLVSDLNLQDRIAFLGYQTEIATYQSFFDVCVLGSANEAFGLVAIESYIQKTPVLVFDDGGGVVEIVEKFEAEDICTSEDNMVKRLAHYKNNTLQWNQEKSEFLEFFSLKRMEQDYYNQYKEIA